MLVRLVGTAHAASLRPAARRFHRALADPRTTQRAALRRHLDGARDSDFGREHGLDRVRDLAGLRGAVPVRRADAFTGWLDRVAAGEPDVLTTDPVLMVEETGGSHGTKRIPYTRGLLGEVSAATDPWLRDLWLGTPGLRGTRSYWAVSPATRPPGATTAGGVPIGFEDDTAYFGPVARWALRRMLAVPSEVARVRDPAAWRDATARHLAAADLGLLSVWSPSFLIPLMRHLEEHLDRLLPPRRRRAVEARLADGAGLGEALWPRLALLSCWTDGPSADAALWGHLRRWFPRTPVQGKGLLATEGVVSVPLVGHPGAALAVASHLLEFVVLDGEADGGEDRVLGAASGGEVEPERVVQAHELEPGGRYSPVLTTAGGLCRYLLGDVVRCVGRVAATPLVRFEGRLDDVCDLRGEKVHAAQAATAIAAARAGGLEDRFAMLAPLPGEPPRYGLLVDSDAPDDALRDAARVVDEALAATHPYAHARRLDQLGPVAAVRVEDGWKRYEATLVGQGRRAGTLKATALHAWTGWEEATGGERL